MQPRPVWVNRWGLRSLDQDKEEQVCSPESPLLASIIRSMLVQASMAPHLKHLTTAIQDNAIGPHLSQVLTLHPFPRAIN